MICVEILHEIKKWLSLFFVRLSFDSPDMKSRMSFLDYIGPHADRKMGPKGVKQQVVLAR